MSEKEHNDDQKGGLVPSGDNKPANTGTTGGIKIGLRTGVTGGNAPQNLRARTFNAEQKRVEREEREASEREADKEEAPTKPNRLCLMLDLSGSMRGTSIIHLQQAYDEFVRSVDLSDTSVAPLTFPLNDFPPLLCSHLATLIAMGTQLIAGGGTPMGGTMKHALENIGMTRGIIISDGDATDNAMTSDGESLHELFGAEPTSPAKLPFVIAQAHRYAHAEIPIDTVHIGSSTAGETLLKEIARITGGIYMKFRDTGTFARALHYLSPRFRGMLMSGEADKDEMAAYMGADELHLPPAPTAGSEGGQQ